MKYCSFSRKLFLVNLFLCLLVCFTAYECIAYDNKITHTNLNKNMLNNFLSSVKYAQEFSNYQFKLEDTSFLKGKCITITSPDWVLEPFKKFVEKEATSYYDDNVFNKGVIHNYFTGYDWIVYGGFSADMPSAEQGLRHFYDPLYPPIAVDGDVRVHYLTDYK